MLMKTGLTDRVRKFLEKDLLINLNMVGIMENVPEALIYVDSLENPQGVFICNGYMHYIYTNNDEFIDEVVGTFLKDGFFGFSGVEVSIAEKIKSRFKVNWENPCTLYYLPEERLDLGLIKNPIQPIDIKDAAIVDKYYQYRNEWSIERIKRDIKERPSSAVYVGGDLACWVLVHEDNSMGIMYTREEYRRKGYAVDVTIDLASSIIKKGKIPFLQIVEGNNMSPGLANKCGFVECGHVTWFGIIAGTPKE